MILSRRERVRGPPSPLSDLSEFAGICKNLPVVPVRMTLAQAKKTNDLIDVRALLRFREFIVAAFGTPKPCKPLETTCKVAASKPTRNHASKQATLQNLANRSRRPAKSQQASQQAAMQASRRSFETLQTARDILQSRSKRANTQPCTLAGQASKPCKPLETSCKVAASEPTSGHASKQAASRFREAKNEHHYMTFIDFHQKFIFCQCGP